MAIFFYNTLIMALETSDYSLAKEVMKAASRVNCSNRLEN